MRVSNCLNHWMVVKISNSAEQVRPGNLCQKNILKNQNFDIDIKKKQHVQF